MFFMMGITDRRKNLDYNQTEICSVCGRYGRFQVFMTYTVLSLFLFRVSNGTDTIMCRPVVVTPCMNWIGKSVEESSVAKMCGSYRNICKKLKMVDRGITMVVISVARIVGMRQPKTLCFARNAVCGCNGNCAA